MKGVLQQAREEVQGHRFIGMTQETASGLHSLGVQGPREELDQPLQFARL